MQQIFVVSRTFRFNIALRKSEYIIWSFHYKMLLMLWNKTVKVGFSLGRVVFFFFLINPSFKMPESRRSSRQNQLVQQTIKQVEAELK